MISSMECNSGTSVPPPKPRAEPGSGESLTGWSQNPQWPNVHPFSSLDDIAPMLRSCPGDPPLTAQKPPSPASCPPRQSPESLRHVAAQVGPWAPAGHPGTSGDGPPASVFRCQPQSVHDHPLHVLLFPTGWSLTEQTCYRRSTCQLTLALCTQGLQ